MPPSDDRTLEIPRVAEPPPPPRPRRRRRRRWPRRLVVLALLAVLVGLGAMAYVDARLPDVDAPSLDPAGLGTENYLIVGSDSRENVPEGYEDFFGGGGGQRADVIMVAHAVGTRAQILSIPRDLKVEIPGQGTDKINAAYAYGGPDLMVQAVKGATGLPIHRYLEVDFVGFAQIVDAMGGVDLYFPYAARDDKSGLSVEAGTSHIDGPTALAFARSRSYMEQRDGEWVTMEGDDIGRTRRQQQLIFAMLAELEEPATWPRIPLVVEAVSASVVADAGLGPLGMAKLVWRLPFLRGDNVEAVTLPVTPSNEGGVSYVVPVEPQASAVLDAFRRGEPMTPAAEAPPSLRVLNGNGVPGAAGEMAERLRAEGFEVTEVADADRQDHPTTLILAAPDDEERARMVRERLGIGEVRVGSIAPGAEVVVIVGMDAAQG